jgi:MFS family permease
MKTYYLFLKNNLSGVSFGFLLTMISSFGQTFLISLYVPEIIESFGLSNASFGALYSVCTVTSSMILLSVGHFIDHKRVRYVTLYSLLLLAGSAVLLGLSSGFAMLVVAIVGLRLGGQGLMSHISLTVMSRSYNEGRGKALSLSSLGYSAGEALFPSIVTFLILNYGWNVSAIVSGVAVMLIFIPLTMMFDMEAMDDYPDKDETKAGSVKPSDFLKVMKGRSFWRIAPAVFFLGFTVTAIFFYQLVIGKINDWPVASYALGFTFYAASRAFFSLVGGKWIDKWGASFVFSIHMFPFFTGILAILIPGIAGAYIFLILTGVSFGLSGPAKSAILAEEYGNANLGAIRSLYTVVMVVSTALGPLFLGHLLDSSVPMYIMVLSMALPVGISGLVAAFNK